MPKSPYKFPARSRAAMADAIESIGHYRSYGFGRERYPFCWNVKLDGLWRNDASTLNRASEGEHALRPEWDSEFESYCEGDSGQGVFERVAESMWEQAESYSTWPGDDSGAWGFDLAGRSGGWLCLTKTPVGDVSGQSLDELLEQVRDSADGWPFNDVRTLYRGLVCMDSDFARAKIDAETQYQLAYVRAEWEESREEKIRELWNGAREARELAQCLAIELRGAADEIPPTIEAQSRERRRELLTGARRDMREAWELLGDLAPSAVLEESGE